jgi:hypothetical protein
VEMMSDIQIGINPDWNIQFNPRHEVSIKMMQHSLLIHCSKAKNFGQLLILNFHRVLNIVCILLGISPASDCDLPTFRNLLSVPSLKMELTEGSETLANHNLTLAKYPKEYIQFWTSLPHIKFRE